MAASRALETYWAEYFSRENSAPGLPRGSISDPAEIRLLNAYFAWATWATVANRPGQDYTYTNNWPYDPDAGNHPSTQAYVWSALSQGKVLERVPPLRPEQGPHRPEEGPEESPHPQDRIR